MPTGPSAPRPAKTDPEPDGMDGGAQGAAQRRVRDTAALVSPDAGFRAERTTPGPKLEDTCNKPREPRGPGGKIRIQAAGGACVPQQTPPTHMQCREVVYLEPLIGDIRRQELSIRLCPMRTGKHAGHDEQAQPANE